MVTVATKKKLARPAKRLGLGLGPRDGSGPRGPGAATTDENKGGEGLDAYKSGRKKPRYGAATTGENSGGRGLDAYTPKRKKKPVVAKPKGWNKG